MVDADHLRIVFLVNSVGFIMSVADLLAIRGVDEAESMPMPSCCGSFQLGSLRYRDTEIIVYDLASLFDLPENDPSEKEALLIFAGSDAPWAIKADHVLGVFDEELFELRELPTYLLRDEFVPYSQVALHDGRLLVSVDSQRIDQAWRRSG